MKTLYKTHGKDFIILNLTDPQIGNDDWIENRRSRAILEYTLKELIERTHPDLITVTGDIAWAGQTDAYRFFAEFIDAFGIPWAPVWGNHDTQDGYEYIDMIADMYLEFDNILYEKGDPAFGNGNYIIKIEEDGRVVHGVFMIDSHSGSKFINEEGVECDDWGKVIPEQIEWYKTECNKLKEEGCNDTSMFMHIPITAYRTVWNAAYKTGLVENTRMITLEESYTDKFWNEGYTDSFGVFYEGVCCCQGDDGVFGAMKECGTTRHIVAGHDHINNFVINYEGIKFIYGTKIGEGCYWRPFLNGGTVLTVTENGITDVHHEYVDVSQFLE
ncbi:MAG: hypothetical protein E7672_00665 [Ruminococcaceae bacterium]|nr:hypothetical protein [Oscillospiraceae bacterium]